MFFPSFPVTHLQHWRNNGSAVYVFLRILMLILLFLLFQHTLFWKTTLYLKMHKLLISSKSCWLYYNDFIFLSGWPWANNRSPRPKFGVPSMLSHKDSDHRRQSRIQAAPKRHCRQEESLAQSQAISKTRWQNETNWFGLQHQREKLIKLLVQYFKCLNVILAHRNITEI